MNNTGANGNLNCSSKSAKHVRAKRDASGVHNDSIGAKWEPSDIFENNLRLLLTPVKLHTNGFQFISKDKDEEVDNGCDDVLFNKK